MPKKTTDPKSTTANDQPMSFVDHLVELRNRLMWAMIPFFTIFAVAYYFADHLILFLAKPLEKILLEHGGRMIYTGLAEAFVTYIKVSFFAALFFAFPFMAVQIWKFVAPGLYKQEKKAFLPFLIMTPLLFLAGAALAYYFVFPLAWEFFATFQIPGSPETLSLQLEPKIDEYLSLSMKMIFAFGLCFQLPVLLSLLAMTGFVTAVKFRQARKYMLLAFFAVAAVLTPPDVISQVCLAIPLILLYEVSILLVTFYNKPKKDA